MKKIYFVKLSFLILLGFFFYNSSFANYISKANFEGDYENPSAWNTDQWPNRPPSVDGYVSDAAIEISTGAKITRNGNFNPVTLTVKGTFIVKGNYINNQWGGVTIEKDGKLEIFGDLNGSAGITVKNGGLLIVHGNLSSSDSGITSHGDIIVVGNFSTSSSTTVHNTGNLIVGGDFAHAGGGFSINGSKKDTKVFILDPNAEVFFADGSVLGKNPDLVGDLNDFLEEETGTPLGDIVNEVVVSVVLGTQWKIENDNSYWSNSTNWSGNKVPIATSNVRIKSADYYPTILATDELVEVNNLTIEEGASLILRPGAQLTVNGNLTVKNGGRLLLDHEYGEGKMASLITNGEVEGEVETKLTLPQNQWFYIGSSRKDAVFSDFGAGNEGVIINVYRAAKWWGVKSGLAGRALRPLEGITTNFQPADGDLNRVITYTGELHNAAVSRTFDESGYHLLANPYPSFIDWENTESLERPNIDGTMWYRSKIGEEMVFVTYNRNAPRNAKVALSPYENMTLEIEKELSLIPPMQAVWVNALESGASLTVHPSARTHGEATSMLKSSRSSSAAVIRIEANNMLARDGAVLYFAEGADEGFDSGDSEKMFNDAEGIPEVFTRVGERAMAINGLPVLENESYSIPLSIRNKTAGEVTLKFDLTAFSGDYVAMLEDKEANSFTNLLQTNTYVYSVVDVGINNDRFIIHLTVQPVVESEQEEDVNNDIETEEPDTSEAGSDGESLGPVDDSAETTEDTTEEATENAGGSDDEHADSNTEEGDEGSNDSSSINSGSADSESQTDEESGHMVSTSLNDQQQEATDSKAAIGIKSIADKVLVTMSPELLRAGSAYVEIYTLNGRKVDAVPARSSRTLIFLPSERGVYIIRAVANNLVKSERVVNAGK